MCMYANGSSYHAPELIEEMPRIVLSRTRFWMVLLRKGGKRLVPRPLYRSIVEIQVRHLQAIWQGIRNDGKVVVLACDLNLTFRKIVHTEVIGTSCAKVALSRFSAMVYSGCNRHRNMFTNDFTPYRRR